MHWVREVAKIKILHLLVRSVNNTTQDYKKTCHETLQDKANLLIQPNQSTPKPKPHPCFNLQKEKDLTFFTSLPTISVPINQSFQGKQSFSIIKNFSASMASHPHSLKFVFFVSFCIHITLYFNAITTFALNIGIQIDPALKLVSLLIPLLPFIFLSKKLPPYF